MCGGSPLFLLMLFLWLFCFTLFNMSGRFTGEEYFCFNSRSPLSEPEHKWEDGCMCGGSPLFLMFELTRVLNGLLAISCRGEYTGEESLFFNSRSPFSEPESLFSYSSFAHIIKWPFMHFGAFAYSPQ